MHSQTKSRPDALTEASDPEPSPGEHGVGLCFKVFEPGESYAAKGSELGGRLG